MVNQQRGHQKGPMPRTGRTNYTTMDEIPTGEEVLAGTFFLNEHPIIILFDFGASLVASGASYVISTPKGRVDANQIV
jgi:hypothetical protein